MQIQLMRDNLNGMERSEPIRLMIVEDSNFMRKAISKLVSDDHRIEVVSLVGSGEEALNCLSEVEPDIITLDFELPGINGLETLDEIMKIRATPVIMFSAYTKKGADLTLKALGSGATDFIQKPSGAISMDLSRVRDELIEKVLASSKLRAPSKRRVQRKVVSAERHPKSPAFKKIADPEKSILFVASSTGGVQALTEFVPGLPSNFPMPVLIVQHMPPMFTKSLAESLGKISRLPVREAANGDILKAGNVYISPGGWHTTLEKSSLGTEIKLSKEPEIRLRPCADITMETLTEIYGEHLLGIVMTGMGDDGTKGAKLAKAKGGTIIAQDEESSLIFGMPGSIIKNRLADAVWPLDEIAGNIASMLET